MSTPFVTVETVTTTTVKCKCPLCGKHEWTVDHLFESAAKQPQGFYPVYWSCDKCRAKFDIRVYADKHVEMSQTGVEEDPFIPAIVLLKSNTGDNQARPIHAVVWDGSRKKTIAEEQAEPGSTHLDYHFNEGTCPTNWWKNTICLVQDQDPDPHGCFEFVKIREVEELIAWLKTRPGADLTHLDDRRQLIEDNIQLIYPELFEGGETIDGDQVVRDVLTAPMPANVQQVIGGGSLADLGYPMADEFVPIQALNARAWRELFIRLERRNLVEDFKTECSLTQELAEALVESKVAEAHPIQFDAITAFMAKHSIPGFAEIDRMAESENNWVVPLGDAEVSLGRGRNWNYGSAGAGYAVMSLPATIEDEIPPFSQAFHDRVAAEGGRITAAGIVYDQKPNKEE